MNRATITFRIDGDMKAALDKLAAGMDRDRSHRWQVNHIKEGLRQAEAGEFATEAEIAAAFARWRK
jgi:predicted transcriptional regulator